MAIKHFTCFAILLFVFNLSGCGGSRNLVNPPTVQAATASFGGRYLFLAEMHTIGTPNFGEGGIMTVDSNGGFTLIGTFNANTDTSNNIASPNVRINGTYTFEASDSVVSLSATGATDAFSSPARAYCKRDGSYCTVVSANPGQPWQAKMWRDDSNSMSVLSASAMSGSYIFWSDSTFNFFVESGIISFDGTGKISLQSIFNATDGNVLFPPGFAWGCGQYSADSNSAHVTQFFCWNLKTPTDTMAVYCLNDASRCVAIPDLTERGSWVMEFERQ